MGQKPLEDRISEIEELAKTCPSALKTSVKQVLIEYFGNSFELEEGVTTENVGLLKHLGRLHAAYAGLPLLEKASKAFCGLNFFSYLEDFDDEKIYGNIPHLANFLTALKRENFSTSFAEELSRRSESYRRFQMGRFPSFTEYILDRISSEYDGYYPFSEKVSVDKSKKLSAFYEFALASAQSKHLNEISWPEICYDAVHNFFTSDENSLQFAKRVTQVVKNGKCADVGEVLEVANVDLPEGCEAIRRLGKPGNVCTTYLVKSAVGVNVAIKVPHDNIPENVQREVIVKNTSRLWKVHSPYILREHYAHPHKGKWLVIMEPYEKTLEDRIKETGKMPFLEAMKYFEQIADGLAACHKQKIVHPDLAPYNIGIDSDGNIKIADFNEGMYPETSELKQGGIRYSAPQRFRNESLTPCSNLWSLAIIFYEMLTGNILFSSPAHSESQRDARKSYILQVHSELEQAYHNSHSYEKDNELKVKKEKQLDELVKLESIHSPNSMECIRALRDLLLLEREFEQESPFNAAIDKQTSGHVLLKPEDVEKFVFIEKYRYECELSMGHKRYSTRIHKFGERLNGISRDKTSQIFQYSILESLKTQLAGYFEKYDLEKTGGALVSGAYDLPFRHFNDILVRELSIELLEIEMKAFNVHG